MLTLLITRADAQSRHTRDNASPGRVPPTTDLMLNSHIHVNALASNGESKGNVWSLNTEELPE